MSPWQSQVKYSFLKPKPDDIIIRATVEAALVPAEDIVTQATLHDMWPAIVRSTHPVTGNVYAPVPDNIFEEIDLKHFLAIKCRAVSGMEKWGPNKNGDAFPINELLKSYSTLTGKGFYIEHNSFHPDNAIGVIAYSQCLPDEYVMSVPLVDKIAFPHQSDEIRRTLEKHRAGVSIGCIAGSAQCSECGNIAHKIHEVCFLGDTMITMASGKILPIQNVKTGDWVVDADGNYQKVQHVFEREVVKDHVVEIHAETHQYPTFATGNHPYLALKNVGSRINKLLLPPQYLAAQTLQSNDFVYSPNITGEVGGLSPRHMRWLGWYASEGHVQGAISNNGSDYVVGFSLGQSEMRFAHEICELSKEIFGKTPRIYDRRGQNRSCLGINLSCKEAVDFALLHCGRKAKAKMLSDEIMRAPIEWQKQFLASYILGDGTIKHKKLGINRGLVKGTISIATASEQMANQLKYMAQRCGIGARIWKIKNTPGPAQRAKGQTRDLVLYHVYLLPAYTDILKDQLADYFDFDIPKPSMRLGKIQYRNGWVNKIYDIKNHVFSGKVFNLEVANSHTYLANGTAVHNCGHMSRGSSLCVKGRRVHGGRIAHDVCRDLVFYELTWTKLPADQDALSHYIMGAEIKPLAEGDTPAGEGISGLMPDEAALDRLVNKAVEKAFTSRIHKLIKTKIEQELGPYLRNVQLKAKPKVEEAIEEKKSDIAQSMKQGGE